MKIKTTITIKFFTVALVLLFAVLMQSCFTGVEGTGKITLSKNELKATAPTAEEKFLGDVQPVKISEWQPGKRFLVTDEKIRFLAEGSDNTGVITGDTILFEKAEASTSAGGEQRTLLIFRCGPGRLIYPVEKAFPETLELTVNDLAMLIDLDVVDKARERLLNKDVWTKTALWYDDCLQNMKGKKFQKVRIEDVYPGNTFFPLLVKFSQSDGQPGFLLMNVGSSGNESRSFGKLFSLTDPRNNYKNISDEVWRAIQSEQVRLGMTKEECRLSLGNPSDVNTGHNYSNAVEVWYYPYGSYLQFVDGLLVSFK